MQKVMPVPICAICGDLMSGALFCKCDRPVAGDRIKFAEEKQSYKVQAAGERYLVCNKPLNIHRTVLYTVVDLEERIRGTENLIFGAGAETTEECEEMLARLEGRDADLGFTTEISRRNYIGLKIVQVIREKKA